MRFWKKKGFTAIEILVSIGILGIATGLSVPLYRHYLIRNELEIARQNVAQGLQRAKFLSQVSMNDACWGFSTDAVPGRGVLFMCGEEGPHTYASRNPSFDELYTISPAVTVSGITEAIFSKIDGLPNRTGDIILTSITGDVRRITIKLGDEGDVAIPEDWLEICVDPYGENPSDLSVPDSLFEYYESQGAIVGECGENTSTCGNGIVEVGEQCDDGDSVGGDGCDTNCQTEWDPGDDVNCNANANDGVYCDSEFDCNIHVIYTKLDALGYDQLITMVQKDSDGGWLSSWGYWNKPVDGNINCNSGLGPNCRRSLPPVVDCDKYTSAGELRLKVTSWEKKQFWYDGTDNNHWKKLVFINTASGDHPNVYVLSDGDPIPNQIPLQSFGSIVPELRPYIDLVNEEINLPDDYALWLFELDTNSPDIESDFQDLVILVDFED